MIKKERVEFNVKSLEYDNDSEPYPSATPRQVFSATLKAQQEELKTNVLMQRFAASRQRQANDPYRPSYHFVSPENMLNDPNGYVIGRGAGIYFTRRTLPMNFPIQQILKNAASIGVMRLATIWCIGMICLMRFIRGLKRCVFPAELWWRRIK